MQLTTASRGALEDEKLTCGFLRSVRGDRTHTSMELWIEQTSVSQAARVMMGCHTDARRSRCLDASAMCNITAFICMGRRIPYTAKSCSAAGKLRACGGQFRGKRCAVWVQRAVVAN